MAKATGDAGLWLPSEFLADKENGSNADLEAVFGFPSEFPYEFEVSSPAGSTETESSDEEENFFAGLTRRLSQATIHETRKQLATTARDKAEEPTYYSTTKTRDLAGSPQSTLSGIGSWSGRSTVSGDGSPNGHSRVPSPSTAPFADPWEVIYAAAGQVARLKMNGQVAHHDFQNKPLGPLAANMFSNQNLNQVQQQVKQKQQQCATASVWGRQAKPPNNWLVQQQQLQVQNRAREVGYESGKCNRALPLPQPAYPPLQLQRQNQRVHYGGSGFRASVPGGSFVKRGSGGTGVFLPRHYETPSDSRKKTGCAPVLLPAKAVHAMNSNFDDLNAATQPRFTNAFATDYDALVARRNALLMQQRLNVLREEAANCEVRLPQEWTY